MLAKGIQKLTMIENKCASHMYTDQGCWFVSTVSILLPKLRQAAGGGKAKCILSQRDANYNYEEATNSEKLSYAQRAIVHSTLLNPANC